MKKIYFNIAFLIVLICSFFSIKYVNAETLTYTNLFETTLDGNVGSLVTSTETLGTPVLSSDNYYMNNSSLYLDGNSYMQYNFNNLTTFDISFMFYKSNSDPYTRLISLLGFSRAVEIKGSSNIMYFGTDVETGWKQNAWNSMRITRDSNNLITYYVNDVPVYTEYRTNLLQGIRLGQGNGTTNRLTGYIDNLQISNEYNHNNSNGNIMYSCINNSICKGDITYGLIKQLAEDNDIDLEIYTQVYVMAIYDGTFKTTNLYIKYYIPGEFNVTFDEPNGTYGYVGYSVGLELSNKDNTIIDFTNNNFNIYKRKYGHSSSGGNKPFYVYDGEIKSVEPVNPYDGLSYIDIPITDLYDNEIGKWIPYQKYFKTTNADNSYNFYVTYIDDSTSELPSLPLELFVTNDVLDIESHINNIANSVHSSADGYGGGFSVGGGTFGGGGGGGRFTDEDKCLITDNYTFYNNTLSSDEHYGFLSLTPNSCVDISNTTPADYKTQYIRIYYDVSFYESVDDVVDDYIENVNKDLGDYTESIKHYNNPIKEILSYISTFYNGLPTELKYLIISTLIISIYLVIIRFIL